MVTADAQYRTSVSAEVDGGLGMTPRAGQPKAAGAASKSDDATESPSSLLAAAA